MGIFGRLVVKKIISISLALVLVATQFITGLAVHFCCGRPVDAQVTGFFSHALGCGASAMGAMDGSCGQMVLKNKGCCEDRHIALQKDNVLSKNVEQSHVQCTFSVSYPIIYFIFSDIFAGGRDYFGSVRHDSSPPRAPDVQALYCIYII